MPAADAAALGAADLARLRAVLESTVRDAGQLAHAMQSAGLKSWMKGGSSPVSEADIAANDLIRKRLQEASPDFGWLSEESEDDSTRLTKRLTWIVDPIDGTRAFIAGREDWCVSVALVDGDAPLLAAVFAPATNELFLAARGQGACRNGIKLQSTAGATFDVARMAGPKYLVERLLKTSADIAPHPRIGSLALRLCRVADGGLDIAFAGGKSRDWDIAAADLIVTEADGKLTSLAGDINLYNRKDVTHDTLVAAGSERHANIMARLRGQPDLAAGLRDEFETGVESSMSDGQLLHLVIGGELTDLDRVTFKDLDQVEIVGVFPNYATAFAAWKSKAQQTVDNAHMRYFIVHLHRLLDPGQSPGSDQSSKPTH